MNLDFGDANGTDSSPTLAGTASYLGGTATPGPGKRLRLSSRRQSGKSWHLQPAVDCFQKAEGENVYSGESCESNPFSKMSFLKYAPHGLSLFPHIEMFYFDFFLFLT